MRKTYFVRIGWLSITKDPTEFLVTFKNSTEKDVERLDHAILLNHKGETGSRYFSHIPDENVQVVRRKIQETVIMKSHPFFLKHHPRL